MANIQELIGSIASKNSYISELGRNCTKECNKLAERMKEIQKETSDASFKCKVSKSHDVSMLHHAFSASISEWAEFLIPILNQNTNSNWSLVAEWFGHTVEPGLLEKYLLKQKSYDVVDAYVVQLSSDDKNNPPIVFSSSINPRYTMSKEIRDEDNADSIFLPDGSIDIDKMESYSFLSCAESFTFENSETDLRLNFELDYPFLRDPIMQRAENYLEQEDYIPSNDDYLSEM